MASTDVPTRCLPYEDVLEQLLEQLNMGRSFEELFDSIYDQLRGIVPYNRIAVALLDEGDDVLRLISCRSDGEIVLDKGYSDSVEGSTLNQLLRTGQPRIINNLEDYFAKKPTSVSTELIVREGMRSNLTLPLVAVGKPIGVIFFSSRKKNTYNKQHAQLLKKLAGHIAISIEKTQLISELKLRNQDLDEANKTKEQFLDKLQDEVQRQTVELRKSEERYRLLVKLGRIVNSSLDLKQVFQRAAEEINELINCDRVNLLLALSRDNSHHGFGIEFQDGKRWVDIPVLDLPGSATQWVMQRRIPHVSRCLDEDCKFPEDQQLYHQGYRTSVYLPLVCRGASLGILGIASRQKNQVEKWDLELLGELSDQIAAALDNATAYGEISRLKSQLEEQNVYLRDEIKTTHDFGNLIGESRVMQEVRCAIQQVAETDSTVLILGETGTGKEIIAREIHEVSPRSKNLLVKVNCAALAPGLITSELFGHEAGAFTGAATQRHGRFEVAQHGSIFLDEIAEVPPETQVMLLRVLQERVLERIGGNDPIEIDVRIIVATNRNLKKHVEEGHFREDLFYRLNVFPIHVPPLRERREDIPSLINYFINRFSRRMDKQISRVSRSTMAMLMSYDWPGNVRELENIVERAMIVSPHDTLEVDTTWLSDKSSKSETNGKILPLAEVERQAILQALEHCNGKIYGFDGAACLLELKPTTFYGKMRKHGVTKRHPVFE